METQLDAHGTWGQKLKYLWLCALLINSITLAFIYLKFKPTSLPQALHYNVLVGVDEYGSGWRLYELPIIGYVIVVINGFLARKLSVDLFLQSILAGMSVVCAVGLFVACLFLTRVN